MGRPDPVRLLVITLCGALELTTYDGSFSLRAGDVLFTRKRSPATIGSRSASNRGGACTPSLTKQPFRPTGPALSRRRSRVAQSKGGRENRSRAMIRCVRIWTGDDQNSHFEEGVIDLEAGQRGDVLLQRQNGDDDRLF